MRVGVAVRRNQFSSNTSNRWVWSTRSAAASCSCSKKRHSSAEPRIDTPEGFVVVTLFLGADEP